MTTSKELIGLGKPDPFQGDPSDLDRFFNDCHLFLDANKTMYDTDKKKVIFMLSYLKGGNAERYKTLWMEQKKTTVGTGSINYGTLAQLAQDLQTAFKETNKKHNALYKMRHIKQGSESIDDFNNKFKLLVSQTKITDDLTLIDAYRDAIKPQIARQILLMETVPTTITAWYEKASVFNIIIAASPIRLESLNQRTRHTNPVSNSKWLKETRTLWILTHSPLKNRRD
jgi:hypothetical protein